MKWRVVTILAALVWVGLIVFVYATGWVGLAILALFLVAGAVGLFWETQGDDDDYPWT